MLEWTSAAHSAVRFAAARTRIAAWRALWISPAVAAACAALMVFTNPWALLPAAPILLLWIAAPEIAVWTSRSRRSRRPDLTADERAYLRRLARRTWLYFETFAGPEDNWLPPDNFQEQPHAELAHRTSPTNVGMMFLSTITAWDFGYLGSSDLNARVHAALDTLDRLERYRGHFLNWYDTRLLHSLEPRYVSTVDSGNLAVCLRHLEGMLPGSGGCAGPAQRAVGRPGRHPGAAGGRPGTRAARSDVRAARDRRGDRGLRRDSPRGPAEAGGPLSTGSASASVPNSNR